MKDVDLLALGHAVRRAREHRGISQRQLAQDIGRDESTITRVEFGRHAAHVDVLWDIANALGLPLSRLIADAELDPEASP